MKPCNFPARKKARQIAAELRATTGAGFTARELEYQPEIVEARAIRTKINRSSTSLYGVK